MRLPLQVHPSAAFAQEHLGSQCGKTESWLAVETRVVDAEEPYLLLGFVDGVKGPIFGE
jgi:mannose-6-phosphate isomerase